MSPRMAAVRAGLRHGWIELRQNLTSGRNLWAILSFPVCALIIMFVLRSKTVPGTQFSLGSQSIPGILGMSVVLNGITWLTVSLTMDREDGTLLRARAIPNGVIGYLVGKVLSRAGMAVVGLVIPLVLATFLFNGLDLARVSSWLTLTWVLAIGLLAVLPIGVVLGALFSSPQSVTFVTLPITALMGISGVFYPISRFSEWLQWIAQAFPIYWLALGLRSAMLPPTMAAAEIGSSWRPLETLGVLSLWAIAGLALAPVVLRRMARRESGSAVAVRRQKAIQRTA